MNKKMMIAGMLATLVAGSGLAMLLPDNGAAAAPVAASSSPPPAAPGGANAPNPAAAASDTAVSPDATTAPNAANRPQPGDGHPPKPPGNRPPKPDGQCDNPNGVDDAGNPGNPNGADDGGKPARPGSPKKPGDPANPGRPGNPGSHAGGADSANTTSTTVQGDYTVVISGGFDTDPQDRGRPVALVAAALGVPAEVFREAFSGVTPAGLDRGPTAEEAQSNKAALMSVLAPYGITNERLDEVSNYYRYNGRTEATWQKTLATAVPILTDGKITGVEITNPGAGYSSAPTVTITGPDGTVAATAEIALTQDFQTNGSLSSIMLN